MDGALAAWADRGLDSLRVCGHMVGKFTGLARLVRPCAYEARRVARRGPGGAQHHSGRPGDDASRRSRHWRNGPQSLRHARGRASPHADALDGRGQPDPADRVCKPGEFGYGAQLGAGRSELIRQLLAETLLLSLMGGAVGLTLAQIGLAGLARMHPGDLPQLDSIGIDWRVLAFTLLVSLATSLLFGVAPALTGTRLNLVDALKQGGRSGSSGRPTQRLRNALVVTELAMS